MDDEKLKSRDARGRYLPGHSLGAGRPFVKGDPRAGPGRRFTSDDPRRPVHTPTPETRAVVARLAGLLHASHKQIALALGIAKHTLERHYRDELARAQVTFASLIVGTYAAKCLGGTGTPDDPYDWKKADTNAVIFFLKARLGWTERTDVDVTLTATPRLGRDFDSI
jgi:hypothetical protein